MQTRGRTAAARRRGLRVALAAAFAWVALGVGCSKSGVGEAPVPAAARGEAAEASSAAEPPAPTKPGKWQLALASAGHPLKRAEVGVSDAQLRVTGAVRSELLDVEGTPLRVLLLGYDSMPDAARAIQKIVMWVNSSGLLHHGEATAMGDTVIVVGTGSTAEPSAEDRAMFDTYMDAFLETEAAAPAPAVGQ